MAILLTSLDKSQINNVHPTLSCSLKRQVVWGTLSFACGYDEARAELVFANDFDNFIQDAYEIRIDFKETDTFGFPQVFEESGRLEAFGTANGISLCDLHVNSDGSCCLGIYPEYQWAGVVRFINEKIISYFYWQSFYRMYGRPPWDGYAHGADGLTEALVDAEKIARNLGRSGKFRNHPCPCGSSKKYKNCCRARKYRLAEILNSNGRRTTRNRP